MSSITFEILFILLLILANGLFAMSEIAVLSARKTRLEHLANRGDVRAKAALELSNSPNRFLSTVQIGITLVGILAGAFGGATLAEKLEAYLGMLPFVASYSVPMSLILVVLCITYLSLVVGELVPKRLALNAPEQIATNVAIPMRLLAAITSPVVNLLSHSTELGLKLFGVGPSASEPLVTEDEIKVLLQQGTEAGTFAAAEQDMVERVFRLDDQPLSALMTPRPDIVWLDLNDSAQENNHKIIQSKLTRFPVCQDTLDNVLGLVHVNDLLTQSLTGESIDLAVSLRQPLFVPETTRALKILEMFKQCKTSIALTVDEYGVIQGLVTLHDILEAIIGDLPSVDQPEESPAVQREDGSWLLDGMLSVERFKELFDMEELPGEAMGNYQTLGGFVITYLGRIPNAADHFEWKRLRFEVMDMDGNRVDKVLVMPKSKPDSQL
ncbi:MAG: HlyC/CorC family transporter [Cyanothece sp. SIO1E1]|nr:HlyC/CorC family transporter [Cyanothece sp. SIO1E1]